MVWSVALVRPGIDGSGSPLWFSMVMIVRECRIGLVYLSKNSFVQSLWFGLSELCLYKISTSPWVGKFKFSRAHNVRFLNNLFNFNEVKLALSL